MSQFLTTSGTSHQIENVIRNAKEQLTLVSPYLKISNTLQQRLQDASKRDVPIIIVYGKDELTMTQKKALKEIDTLKLYYYDNLHAKCYFNEHELVITSMNMYEFSEINNREMGIYISRDRDPHLYDGAIQETDSILSSSILKPLKKPKKQKANGFRGKKAFKRNNNKNPDGFCIRCETPVKHDIERPLCNECYTSWVQFGNPFYEENVCHSCGEVEPVSMNKPECYSCYKKTV